MIRSVVLGRLNPDADRDLLDRGLTGVAALQIEGMTEIRVGTDAGLRPGNWDYVITADFTDVEAYRRYDENDEHNRLRREAFGPVSAEIARAQLEL